MDTRRNAARLVAIDELGVDMNERSKVALGTYSLFLVTLLCWAGSAAAQLPPPGTPWQFDVTGFLQEATVANPADPLSAGQLKVNGHVVTVPANTIVILPANALTWQELFAKAPAPWGIPGNPGVTSPVPTTGMAMADCAVAIVPPATACPVPPLTTYEVHVAGNVVGTQWIAGIIDFSQQGLNQGQGYVTAISYVTNPATGAVEAEMQVATGDIVSPIARVRINDPVIPALGTGRYSSGQSPDVRFTVDQDNPTIRSATGFPMCLPRGSAAADPLCPQGNRPQIVDPVLGLIFAGIFTTPDPSTLAAGQLPDPRIQAPFEVGDYVTFNGNLVKDSPVGGFLAGDGPTAGPWPGIASTYVSAHTVTNNVAIYTFPGTNPAYVATEVTLLGTGGVTVIGATEAAVRTRFEGFTTDPSRVIHLYGMDLTSAGVESDRDWGLVGVDPGLPTGAVKGRWRFRPPCTATPTTITEKKCSPPAAGVFLPATREVRAVLEAFPGSGGTSAWVAGLPTCGPLVLPPCNTVAANGLISGQYHAPITTYIFPEQIIGNPVPPANFDTIPFLASGGYSSSTGVLAPGPLVPFPTSAGPAVCTPPTALAGAPASVATGQVVTLDGSASSGGPPVTFAWTQAPTDAVLVALANANTAVATFTAPAVAAPTNLNFTLTVSACGTSASTSVVVTVGAATAPTVSYTPVSPVSVSTGTPVTIVATGVDPTGLPVSVSWTQTNAGAAGVPTVVTPNPMVCGPVAGTVTCTLSFTVSLPLGQPAVTIQLAAQATNSLGQSSGPDFTSVTVNPLPDAVTITSAEYRTSKQRLIINATSSVISPSVVLTLQPYLLSSGLLYNPCPPGGPGCAFTNNGGGLYLLDIVGAPEPQVPPATPLVVTSSLGGVSAPSALTRIRQ
jgi:hypothetical protein